MGDTMISAEKMKYFGSLLVPDLKKELKRRGASQKGRKKELLER
jgi:hypothetical protein